MGWVKEDLEDEFKPPFPGGGGKRGENIVGATHAAHIINKALQELLAYVQRQGVT